MVQSANSLSLSQLVCLFFSRLLRYHWQYLLYSQTNGSYSDTLLEVEEAGESSGSLSWWLFALRVELLVMISDA